MLKIILIIWFVGALLTLDQINERIRTLTFMPRRWWWTSFPLILLLGPIGGVLLAPYIMFLNRIGYTAAKKCDEELKEELDIAMEEIERSRLTK